MPRKDRKVKGTDLATYTWEGIPRDLLDAAHEKCRASEPKTTLKQKLVELVSAWVRA